jgi:GNAT superfamily N-acetyltransferase
MLAVVRPAQIEDTATIAQLVRELAEYERLSHQVVLKEADLREQLFGPTPRAEVLIAEDDGVVAGFALYFSNFSTFLCRPGLYLEDLFVRPRYRHKGHGKALLRELARIAVQRACGRLEWAVLDWNKPAIDFYRGLGAVPMEEWMIFRLTGEALHQLGGDDEKA